MPPQMLRRIVALCSLLLVCFTAAALADFKLYPGARTDEWSAKAVRAAGAALPPGSETQLYVTPDLYDKVYAFYKQTAHEAQPMPGPVLPNGMHVRWSFFLLDNATTLAASKWWLKVQRPTVVDLEMKDVRDITSIQVVRKK